MTVLAERPEVYDDLPPSEHEHGPSGFLKWVTSTDHKVIGKNYTVTAVIFFLLAGAMAMLIRAQLANPDSTFLSQHTYNEMFTMHGSLMIYLFVGPVAFGGLANYIVPLQIGAPDMAFPRLNALSYWLYLGGGTLMMMGFLTTGSAADFGWVAYAPLSNSINTPGAGPDLWIVALVLTGFSAIFTGVNLVSTIYYLRAPGMTMFRMPIFTWNMLVTGILILIAFPVFTSALVSVVRQASRRPHLRGLGRGVCVAGALARPLLVLRPSRGLHPRPAVLRHRDRRHRRVLPKAHLRLPGDGLRDDLDRGVVHERVGAPHVHDRRRVASLLPPHVVPDRRSDGDQILQLDRNDVAGAR